MPAPRFAILGLLLSSAAFGASVTTVHINEVESNGGVPGDWIELVNTGASPADVSGWSLLDNDDTHAPFKLPPGTMIAAGGYLVVEEADLGFGLGAADSVRLYDPTGTLFESYSWTAHATTTYGRCPDGTGEFTTTADSSKGAPNQCSVTATATVHINEVESNGGVPGDWIELFNTGAIPMDLSGWSILDNDDTHSPYKLPAGTTIAARGYLVVEEADIGFGLGAADSVRLYDPTGTLYETYSWTAHAATTYGRCPNGTGDFVTTVDSTKGAPNQCPAATASVHINEVESNGGVPGDWIELFNPGASAVDLSGWSILDNDDTHSPYKLPAGTTISGGGYLVVEEADFGFGLGAPDAVRLYNAAGALVESYSWTAHAATTYGRCPNATGNFITTISVTKGAANDCASVKINEVESSGGVPGDWVELYNAGTSAVDISGYLFRDNDDTHTYTIPAGTILPGGGYYVLEEAALGFGLGSADSARLSDRSGAVIDSYTWTDHATTTYGRCPNGTGGFATTNAPTKGSVNDCPGGNLTALPWPGGADVKTVDGPSVFGGNLSGLIYEGADGTKPGVLWGIRNGPGSLFRLIWIGMIWTPDPANNWGAGKNLAYPGGTGSPDSEGLTFASGSLGGIYVSTERDNNANGLSRNSILRFDTTGSSSTLTATHEWNLTPDLPAVGANLGIEGITWIPDSFLVAKGFFDESKGHLYNPNEYPFHGAGLFFVGLEANGLVYGYALTHLGGGFTRVATIATGLSGVMDVYFDRELNDLWAVCDDTCQGRTVILRINPATGKFTVARLFERPGLMPNLNNEGFTIAPLAQCVNGTRPVFWSDDSETGGHAIRQGSVSCGPI